MWTFDTFKRNFCRVSLEKDRELNYTELFKEIGYLIHLYDFDTIDLNNIAYLQGVIEKLKPISNISLDIKPLLKYVRIN